MKYSFKPSISSKQINKSIHKKVYRLAGYEALRRYREKFISPIPLIDLAKLFEELERPLLAPPEEKERISFLKTFLLWLSNKFRKKNKRAIAEKQPRLAMLSGILCAALTVTLLSAVLSLLPFVAEYSGKYTVVEIPDFTALSYEDIVNFSDERFSFVIDLEENPDRESGDVISQTPKAGAIRRLYSNDERLTVTLKVCRQDELFIMEDLRNTKARDAILTLRNEGMRVTVTEEYSDDHPYGTVIESSPSCGEALARGENVSLRVSLGKKISYVSLPKLLGLSESEAISKLEALGFNIGEIDYSPSDSPSGVVISQSPVPASLPYGSTVSFTVSLGSTSHSRVVPDLYGMTLTEAQDALKAVGLVIGRVYYLGESSSDSKVVKQTPAFGVQISSSLVSVDVYLGG